MGTGKDLRDKYGLERYVREHILPHAPDFEPVPFRGFVGDSGESLPFLDEMEAWLLERPGASWNVVGAPGLGKTCLARWAAARWGQRFLEDPDRQPVPLWVERLQGAPASFRLPRLSWDGGIRRRIFEHGAICIADDDRPVAPRSAVGLPAESQLGWSDRGRARVLYAGLSKIVPGPVARLAPWDVETAFLAARSRLGQEGTDRVARVRASPAGALLGYPLFVGKILELEDPPAEDLEREGGVEAVLRKLHAERSGGPRYFTSWCEALLTKGGRDADLREDALRLRLPDSRDPSRWGSIFRGFLLRVLLLADRCQGALKARLLEREELEFLTRITPDDAIGERFRARKTSHPVHAANRVNLHWHFLREPVLQSVLESSREGLVLPGYRFPRGLKRLALSRSDLSGSQLGAPLIEDSSLEGCELGQAGFRGAKVVSSVFLRCRCRLTDLSDCTFERCRLEDIDLSEASVSGSRFRRCTLRAVTFGPVEKGARLTLERSDLRACALHPPASGARDWLHCHVLDMSFAGLRFEGFKGSKSTFARSDFLETSMVQADLKACVFNRCLMAGSDLRGADLRGALFVNVDFQPGPSSRCGHTEPSSRDHPMYGSQSGFYSQSVSDGVWGAPELLRTADLRDADLRGVRFRQTDLFRVDLRGARMDAQGRALAARMGAFLDEVGEG